jgi:probable rRNA maturation factor
VSNTPANSQPELAIEMLSDACLPVSVDGRRIEAAVREAVADQGFKTGEIGIRFTDDITIRQLNRDHLDHDFATDVISFPYSRNVSSLQGEMVVSVETAVRQASELGWPAEHELLLYVVHGTLHLAGLDDQSPVDQAKMRQAERRVMLALGIDQIDRFGPAQNEELQLGVQQTPDDVRRDDVGHDNADSMTARNIAVLNRGAKQ